MVAQVKRITLIVVGAISLGLAALGVLLPLLPTTPFVLVAAVAFAKSSNRLHQWLLDHDIFGPLISDWRQHRAISRKTKIASILSMVAILVISFLLDVPTYLIVVQALILGVCAAFIVSRPLPPHR